MVSVPGRVSLPPQARSFLASVRRYIPLDFITLHYAYYFIVCMVSAIIFWGSSTPAQSITFTDSLFLTVSAMTQAGLNTVNLSQLNTWQQVILLVLILVGSAILISCAVVHTRKVAFEKRFADVIEKARERRRAIKPSISFPRALSHRRMTNTLPVPAVDGVVVRGRPITTRAESSGVIPGRLADQEEAEQEKRPSSEQTQTVGSSADEAHQSGPSETAATNLNDQPDSEGAKTTATRPSPIHDAIQRIRFADAQPKGIMSPHRMLHSPAAMSPGNLHFHVRSPRAPHRSDDQGAGLTRGSTRASGEGLRMSSARRDEFRSTSKYFESDGLIGRNSQFHSLSLAEREQLGGVEYRAVVLLEYIVVIYYVLFQLLGAIGLGAWIANNAASTTLQNGLNPWWVGAFLSVSAFNNNGMSLLDANMVAFQSSIYVLITSGLLILAGNTCYPVFLRLILWSLYKLLPDVEYFEDTRSTLKFLLDHPRRCYTTLFPSTHTWWLVGSLVVLNGVDWIAYEVLNIDNGSIYTTPNAPKALDGLFQALAVRSGGFYVVPIANLRIGLLVLYVLMMYISVYPVTITIRNSNVYEERSLGIYADDPDFETEMETRPSKIPAWLSSLQRPSREGSRSYFVRQQLRGQLAHDLWWLCLAVLFISIIETQQFGRDPVTFSVFNILFETVSAYGCVGISTGAPNVAFSFSGEWHVLSKLILCAVMLRGRHRGLPVAIDRAVLLPGEHLAHAEEEDAAMRRELTQDRKSTRQQTHDFLAASAGPAVDV